MASLVTFITATPALPRRLLERSALYGGQECAEGILTLFFPMSGLTGAGGIEQSRFCYS